MSGTNHYHVAPCKRLREALEKAEAIARNAKAERMLVRLHNRWPHEWKRPGREVTGYQQANP